MLIGAWLLAAVSMTDADCITCHEEKAGFQASVHHEMGCTSCHDTITDYPHPEKPSRPDCATCHEEPVKALGASAHAKPDGPSCVSCHGDIHTARAVADPLSPAHKTKLPETCGACHADPAFQAKHKVAMAKPVEAFRASVHGQALQKGRPGAASCSDCHGSHGILPASDSRSPINHFAVPKTCGTCHQEVEKAYEESVHGQAAARGVSGVPVCTDCHGEHSILAPSEPGSLVNPARVSTVTCARCHADERLAQKFNLDRSRVPAFEESYHGLALRSGRTHVANCASCHGVHKILPSSNPHSMVNPANLAQTCGRCHEGAGQRFALGPVHVGATEATTHPLVRSVRWAYLLLIPLTIGLMLLHNGLDFLVKLWRPPVNHHGGPEVPRMGLHFRIAHGLTVLSFPVLVLTGFALKFPEAWWAAPLLTWESGVGFRGLVHRIAGVVLLLALGYHVVHLVTSRGLRPFLKRMLPRRKDLTDVLDAVRYNLGLQTSPPRFGVFSYAEKAEYWAYLWGTAVMAVTGFVLWGDDLALRHLPKWASDLATATHYYEAILATAAIAVWHFYLVIFDPNVYPMEKAWLTGKVPAEAFKRSRPAYYRALMRRLSRPKP